MGLVHWFQNGVHKGGSQTYGFVQNFHKGCIRALACFRVLLAVRVRLADLYKSPKLVASVVLEFMQGKDRTSSLEAGISFELL